jgi:cellulose synthase/poly-beta-1,6-N-acetylglucosamine synthase-like glycosyltransferase
MPVAFSCGGCAIIPNYPKGKLDIKLVVEQDDSATISKIATLRLPGRYDVIVVPPGAPRTKARALDVALPCARGDYLAVYDAEDIPARGQLRAAASRFAAEPDLDCLQARLTVRNAGDSWLSQLFALEYCVLFDLVNPGLSALRLPVALGGTSNHFRMQALRAAGGWDAWNVAEDADLGLRLARLEYRVGALDSDTSEEAPHELANWFRQRVRWQKGWMQTCIVHSRRPLQFVRDLGGLRAWAAVTLIGGGVLSALLAPYFVADTLWRAFTSHVEGGLAWREAVDLGVYLLAIGGLQVILLPALVVKRRGRVDTPLAYLALLPAYYLMIAAASATAAWQLFRRPFHWGKTAHGRARSAPRPTLSPLTRRALLSIE